MGVQTQCLRAVIWPLLNPDTGLMYCDSFSWRDLEPERETYRLDGVEQAIGRAKSIGRFALLRVVPEAPEWSVDPARDYLRLITALGERFGGERALLGVDVLCPDEDQPSEVMEAFASAFPNARLFVQAGSPFERAAGPETRLGLIVTRENAAACADRREKLPLRMAVDPASVEEIDAAIQAGVSILEARTRQDSNAATHAGHRFQVLSVTLDDTRKAEHQVGVQVTLANAGTLPCYSEAGFRVRLSGLGVDDAREYTLPLRAANLRPAQQVTVSQVLDTEGLTPGEYDVHIGLFFDGTKDPVSFGIEGRISDGYYEGRLILSL